MSATPVALVVDDSPTARHRVAVLLQLAGWQVYEAVGAPAALRTAAQVDPDLVVTDVRLRGGSGVALVHQLRRSGCRARFLLLTARPTERVRAQVAALGAAWLAKPVDPRRLVQFLRSRTPGPACPGRATRMRVAAERVQTAAGGSTPADDEDDEGPSWRDRQREFYLSALPHHLAWIATSAREGDASGVAAAADTLAGESGRHGDRQVASVCRSIASDAERGIVSQPRLMQLVMLASTAGSR
jgi:CheY-like chemotaxis protein